MSDIMSAPETDFTAWAYLVVSSEQQAETIEYQRRWAVETAKTNGWRIAETFEGVSSGKDGVRSLLNTLLARLESTPKAARPIRILMIRLDRLGRGLGLEALAALAEIVRLGVVIHTRQDNDITILRASDSILPLMRLVTGGIENEARRDKANDTYRRRRLAGRVVSNKRPYGLRVEDGHDVPFEPEAMAVRLAFELATNGFGYSSIASRLRNVAPPKTYANGRSHVTEWTNDRVRKLLRNAAYHGTIISDTVWRRARALQAAPRNRTVSKHPWPLSGCLRCECGRMLIGSLRGSPAKRVYRCSAFGVHKKHRTYTATKLENSFIDLLGNLAAKPDLVRKYSSKLAEVTHRGAVDLSMQKGAAEAEITKANVERDRSWRLNADGLLPDVHLRQRLDDIEARRLAAEATIRAISMEQRQAEAVNVSTDIAIGLIQSAATLWKEADIGQQQAAAQSLSRALGGFCVLNDGLLVIGEPVEWNRFFRREAATHLTK